jgi:hypothetical protein
MHTVTLRNGEHAQVEWQPGSAGDTPFEILGRVVNGEGMDSWTKEGCWKWTHLQHPLDIVSGLEAPA